MATIGTCGCRGDQTRPAEIRPPVAGAADTPGAPLLPVASGSLRSASLPRRNARAGAAGRADPADDTAEKVRLIAVGDVLFARYDRDKKYLRVARNGDPFALVRRLLRTADIAFANLETPITAEPARFRTHGRLTFRAEPEDAQVLADAGFDVVSMANNHARDFGFDAVADGRGHLERAGVAAVGAGAGRERALRPAIFDKNGLRVAVVAWTVWLKGSKTQTERSAVTYVRNRDLVATTSDVLRDLRDRDVADAIVVSLHWGWEGEDRPRSSQRSAARALIDAGAHVVAGHHPHVIHDIERYAGGVIAYSLGNFLFDNPAIEQRRTLALEVVIERKKARVAATDVIVHPMIIDRKKRIPRPLCPGEHESWRRKLKRLAPAATIARPGSESGGRCR